MMALGFAAAASAATGPPAVGIVSAKTGAALYAANCSSCHGPTGRGDRRGRATTRASATSPVTARRCAGVGALDRGLLPPHGLHAARATHTRSRARSPCSSRDRQIRELVALRRLARPRARRSRRRTGPRQPLRDSQLFADNCAGCHQIAAEGGYVTGARVPPLSRRADVEIAEAVRIGPYVMPRFSARRDLERAARLDHPLRRLRQAPRDAGGLVDRPTRACPGGDGGVADRRRRRSSACLRGAAEAEERRALPS